MIYIVLAVIILHISVLPITVRVSVNVDTDKGRIALRVKLFFIPVFTKYVRLRADENHSSDVQAEKIKNGAEKAQSKIKQVFNAYIKNLTIVLLKRIRVRVMDLIASIGAGDAAVTATAVGMLKIAYSQVCAFLSYNGDAERIRPDYGTDSVFIDFFGIFSLCFADIIFAAFGAIGKTLGREKRRVAYATIGTERTVGTSD